MDSQCCRGSQYVKSLSPSVLRVCLRQSWWMWRGRAASFISPCSLLSFPCVYIHVSRRIWTHFGHYVLSNLPPFPFSSLDPTMHLCVSAQWCLINSWAQFTSIFYCVCMVENFNCLPLNSLTLTPASIFRSFHLCFVLKSEF